MRTNSDRYGVVKTSNAVSPAVLSSVLPDKVGRCRLTPE